MTHIALTVAGSDSGGGAGIQADLKTFSALGVYGTSAIAALTAQNTVGVQDIHEVPTGFVVTQIDSIFNDIPVDVVKIGMLSNSSVIEAVSDALKKHRAQKIVLDPVMIAASGDRLLASDAVAALKRSLLPMALVVTPNLPEAAALLNAAPARTENEMLAQAREILNLGPSAVLVKGGHDEGPESVDILLTRETSERLSSRRIDTPNTHGTGCTLSSAVAAYLAKGFSLIDSVRAAKAYVWQAISASDRLTIGHGHGPVHHFHDIWSR